MCKLLVVINKNKENKEDINSLLWANSKNFLMERDGYSIVKVKKNVIHRIGRMKYDKINDDLFYDNEDIFIVHFRTATTGKRCFNNLHLQLYNKAFYAAHNGTVNNYIWGNDDEASDSHKFFSHLCKRELTHKNIEKIINKKGFFGKGVIYNQFNKLLYLFAFRDKFLFYGLNDCLIISSFLLNNKIKIEETRSILGFSFTTVKNIKEIKMFTQSLHNELVIFKNGRWENQYLLKDKGNYNKWENQYLFTDTRDASKSIVPYFNNIEMLNSRSRYDYD